MILGILDRLGLDRLPREGADMIHLAPVGEHGKRRIQGVERAAAGRYAIDRAREGQARAAVLPADPGARQDHATAELMIEALNEAHRAALTIHDPEPYGIGRTLDGTPRCRPRGIDRKAFGVEPRCHKPLAYVRPGLEESALVTITHPEGPLARPRARSARPAGLAGGKSG